ncbi:foldase protein PrsA [Pseudooceanicola sp. C21-150M6]|uniref:foldase protein PrsA n=1 Tax=Pseudooceanicola sp. C21-150M6 TaxID=3434355 RepID=UPI003D7F1EDE
MTLRLSHALALILTTALATPALAQQSTDTNDASAADTGTADLNTVVATVNGTDITLGHMILVRTGLPQQYNQVEPELLFDGILQQLIQQTALMQAWEGETPARVDIAIDNQKRSLLAAEEVGRVMLNDVTEDQINTAYQEKYGASAPSTEYKAAHILVKTEEEAKAIVEELKGGADFAKLAQEKSTGPSGPNGGELGWFGPGMMVAPFEEAVVAMSPGSISEPVETQFGWHVIKLDETRLKDAPALDEVRDEIHAEVEQKIVKAYIDEVVENANVDRSGADKIDRTLVNNINLLE